MSRFKPRQEHVGRTNYQLRMPYPGAITPENITANFRELERWGNALPVPRPNTMMPVRVIYTPDPFLGDDVAFPQVEIDFKDVLSTYADGIVPSGNYMFYITAEYSNVGSTPHRSEAVGWRIYAKVDGQFTQAGEMVSNGIIDGGSPMQVITDIDFTAETFETEWRAPIVGPVGVASAFGVVPLDDIASNDITFVVGAECHWITDPTTSGDIEAEPTGFTVHVWMWRLTDGYALPYTTEDITPP